jgi:hypothetical protein
VSWDAYLAADEADQLAANARRGAKGGARRPGPGDRRVKGPGVSITLRLPVALNEKLRAMAKLDGISAQQVVRRLITAAFDLCAKGAAGDERYAAIFRLAEQDAANAAKEGAGDGT